MRLIRPILFACTFSFSSLGALGEEAQQFSQPDWQKAGWIEKASGALRAGEPWPPEKIQSVLEQDKAAIVDELMADPLFGDVVVDFNLYYLGFRPFSLKPYDWRSGTNVYAEEVYMKPQALRAAQQALADGDYFRLLEFEQPSYIAPVTVPAEERQVHRAAIDEAYRDVLQIFDPLPSTPEEMEQACANHWFSTIRQDMDRSLRRFGFIDDVSRYFAEEYRRLAQVPCWGDADPQMIVGRIQGMYTATLTLMDRAESRAGAGYMPPTISDIRTYDRDSLGLEPPATRMTQGGFWRVFENSSTNFNRLRGQYILKTYFCDDLTPVDVPLPDHPPTGGDAHASDPACQACHYRLDPIAGFFRYYGARGRNYETYNQIRFDDGLRLRGDEYEAYLNAWRSETHPGGWNVGFVQSPTDSSQNQYGQSLEDLFAIIAESPLVKQCIAKRMTEYFLGEHQAVHGGWLTMLSQRLQEEPRATSSRAFKAVVKDIVMSETFATQNPGSDECFDAPDGEISEVPCAVAQIVETHCASCHGSGVRLGGLSLTTWVAGDDTAWFEHNDASGQPVPKNESIQKIVDRLSSNDADLLMPPSGSMTTTDRVTFLQWLEQQRSAP